MRDRLILTIPSHIAALPEEEQGPALVREIHQRKALRTAWEYYASIPAPTYDPFKETRAAIGRLDDYARFLAAMYRDPREEVRAILEGGGTSTPPDDGFTTHGVPEYQPRPLKVIADVAPEDVRWACMSPTGHRSRSRMEEMYADYTRGMVDALAGRPYNRKLIGESGSAWTSASGHWGDKQQ